MQILNAKYKKRRTNWPQEIRPREPRQAYQAAVQMHPNDSHTSPGVAVYIIYILYVN